MFDVYRILIYEYFLVARGFGRSRNVKIKLEEAGFLVIRI